MLREAVLSSSVSDRVAFAHDDALLGITRHAQLSTAFREAVVRRWSSRQAVEAALASVAFAEGELRGYCLCCRAPARFAVPPSVVFEGTHGLLPDWGESLRCTSCGLISRLRLCAAELLRHIDVKRSAVYVTEQTTPFFAWLRSRVEDLTGSEFVADDAESDRLQAYLDRAFGERPRLRHEDVTALTFGDSALDAVVSLEVLEHVPEYRRALREFARVLRRGGIAILSVPFGELMEQTVVRAKVGQDGTVTHLLKPEYHGDPASKSGVLCYYHFGWDLLNDIRAAGFATVDYIDVWEPAYGYMGRMAVFVAHR